MTIEKVIDVLNEKKLCMIIDEIPFGNVDDAAKELYVALGVAADILQRLGVAANTLQRYDTGRIFGFLSFLNAYVIAEFYKDDFGRDFLMLHLPEDAKITNWYRAVNIKCDLPSCFRSVPPDKLIERYEMEWEEALKENSECLPFSEGDDDVYDI